MYGLFLLLRVIKDPKGFAGFALCWLAPCAIMHAVSWGGDNDPRRLVLIPLLWTSIVGGVSLFIYLILKGKVVITIFAILGALMLSPLAATVYWAFFSHQSSLGCALLAVNLLVLITAIGVLWWDSEKGDGAAKR
jgi:hypothetical protein